MAYRIDFKPAALRDMKKLDHAARERIKGRIDALALDPRPAGIEKLAGLESTYRLRVGDYRVVYQIEPRVLLVLVVHVGHRREVYRRL